MLSSQPVLVTNTENGQIYPVCPLPLHGTVPLPGPYLLSAEKSLPSKCSSRVTSLRSYINSPDPVFCSSSALTCHIQPPLQNSSLVRMSDIYLPWAVHSFLQGPKLVLEFLKTCHGAWPLVDAQQICRGRGARCREEGREEER